MFSHNIPILLETPQLLVLNKPAGLAVERLPHGYPSVEDWALSYLGRLVRKPFVGIAHRLDRPVSGVLLLVKKRAALKDLNRQFAERQVEKVYRAIVEGCPANKSGTLEHWLIKDPEQKRAIVAKRGAAGAAHCELKYKVLEAMAGSALLEIRPLQGKFHQIRAQLSAAGTPIVGDEQYGATLPYRPGAIALQAWSLRFREPADSFGQGAWITVKVEEGL